MTRRAKAGWQLGWTGLLIFQAGCLGLRQDSPAPMVQPLASTTSVDRPAEVPANQVIQASLTLAQKLEKSDKETAAAEQYEQVLRLDPNNLPAQRRLAVLSDKRCDFNKAEELYRKLAKVLPRDADVYNDWGYSYYLQCKFDEAEKKLRRALELDPNHQRARCNLGLTLGQTGRLEEAKKAFKDAHLSDAQIHCNLAFIHLCRSEKNKDTLAEARCEAELATKLDPYCNQAKLLLAQLDNPGKTPADVITGRLGGKPAASCDVDGCRPGATAPPAPLKSAAARTGNSSLELAKGLPPPVPPVLHRTSDGTAWVAPPYARTPAPAPTPAAPPSLGGTEGSVIFDE